MTGLKNSRWILFAMIMVAPGLVLAPRAAFADGGGEVQPPKAKPHGYSLTDMASAIALFSTSGNNSQYYPDTPFQLLYEDPTTVVVTPVGGGIFVTASNSFTVHSGTPFFVPIVYLDDSPPVWGTFPTTEHAAPAYAFGHEQIGLTGIEIIVDGKGTCIGPDYTAGPVLTPPLLDGDGTHFISIGAFLTPLSVGTHTVSFKATFAGEAFVAGTGLSFEIGRLHLPSQSRAGALIGRCLVPVNRNVTPMLKSAINDYAVRSSWKIRAGSGESPSTATAARALRSASRGPHVALECARER